MVTLDYQVAASGDDGGFWSSTFDNTYTTIRMGYDSSVRSAFMRFTGVTIPVGSIITAACLSTKFGGSGGTIPACTLYFEDAADPAAPTTAADANGRTKTTASMSYTPPGYNSGNWSNSNDFSAIIQELVDSYDYSAGKSMQILVIGAGSKTNYGACLSYDYSGNVSGPKLHIEYTDPSAYPGRGVGRGIGRGIFR